MKIYIPIEEKRQLWRATKEIVARKSNALAGTVNNVNGRSRLLDGYEGLVGEWAVAKILGATINTEAYFGKGDGNVDLLWGDTKVDVKTSSLYKKPSLLVRTDRPVVCDLYIQCVITDDGQVWIAGGAWKSEVVAQVPRKVNKNGPLNYVIKYDNLTPIATLIRP